MILEFLMAYGQMPPRWVSGLGAIGVVAFIVAAIYNGRTNPKYLRKDPINWDLFEIGYILDDRPIPSAPAKTVAPAGAKDNPIYKDCVLALRSLGYTAKDAKNVAEQILETHSISSVEEFIPIALSKRP